MERGSVARRTNHVLCTVAGHLRAAMPVIHPTHQQLLGAACTWGLLQLDCQLPCAQSNQATMIYTTAATTITAATVTKARPQRRPLAAHHCSCVVAACEAPPGCLLAWGL